MLCPSSAKLKKLQLSDHACSCSAALLAPQPLFVSTVVAWPGEKASLAAGVQSVPCNKGQI
jgi:hypothetical protein